MARAEQAEPEKSSRSQIAVGRSETKFTPEARLERQSNAHFCSFSLIAWKLSQELAREASKVSHSTSQSGRKVRLNLKKKPKRPLAALWFSISFAFRIATWANDE